MKTILGIVKKTGECWLDHNAQSMGAALAYYSVLSMAPLVIITIAIAGFVFGRDAAQGQIVYQVRDTVGTAGAEVIQDVLKSAHRQSSGILATAIGVLTLLVSASAVFSELRTSLNKIWEVPKNEQPAGVYGNLRFYAISVTMVLTIGFLLLISLLLSAFLEVFEKWLTQLMPSLPMLAKLVNLGLSFGVISILFALIYKFVPGAPIEWRDVWQGAVATAALFTLGKFGLALYIAKMSIGSAYGAAGSLVAMLVWVYYSAQIFFFGAEFTHIYAQYRDAHAFKRPRVNGPTNAPSPASS